MVYQWYIVSAVLYDDDNSTATVMRDSLVLPAAAASVSDATITAVVSTAVAEIVQSIIEANTNSSSDTMEGWSGGSQ